MLVDSHCHLDMLDLTPYGGDLGAALQAARQNDVEHFLSVCVNVQHFGNILEIADNHKNISVSVGMHPNEEPDLIVEEDELITLANEPHVVAIGETGLDTYRSEGDLTWQHERFRTHIRAAIKVGVPLIIHSRQAKHDTIRIMEEEGADKVGGVMHCFTEDWAMAKRALDLGFHIGFSGIVTFKNATELKDVAKKVPLERILVETDAPFLAPEPYRGKSNEPAYVRYVAEHIADLRGLTYPDIARATTDNYFRLFLS